MASSSNTLPFYWTLGSTSEQQRLSSSSKLVSALLAQQASLEASTSAKTLDDVLPVYAGSEELGPLHVAEEDIEAADRYLDETVAAEVSYAIRRLIKGLASPRENARLGFAVALTELLAHLNDVPTSVLLTLLLKHSEGKGKLSGQEERDLYFARLFGIEALTRSGALVRPTTATLVDFQRAIEILASLSGKKVWLAESAAWATLQAMRALSEATQDLSWKQEGLAWLQERLTSSKGLTPEKLAFLLELQDIEPKFVASKSVPALKGDNVLADVNLSTIARVLKNASSAEGDDEDEAGDKGAKNSAAGNWTPQVHFVWDMIIERLASSQGKGGRKGHATFSEFFRQAVEESLFAATATTERKAWGFQIFNKALPRVPTSEVPFLFTQNFMRTWINHLASKDRMLHRAAIKTAETVQEVVKASPATGFTLVAQLLGPHGNRNFDKITKTKTVESLLASMDVAGVREYLAFLVRTATEEQGSATLGAAATGEDAAAPSSEGLSARRKWAFDQMLMLIRNSAIPKDDSWILDVLSFFCAHGFFALRKAPKSASPSLTSLPKPAYSEELREVCRARFIACLTDLGDQTSVLSDLDGKARRAQGLAKDGVSWLSKAHDVFTSFYRDDKSFVPVFKYEDDEELAALRKNAEKALKDVRAKAAKAKDAAERDRARALESLLIAALLVTADGTEESQELLEPLTDCTNALIADAAPEPADDDEPGPMELFVDCLVGFLERSSAFLRSSANHAFASFAAHMTAQSLDHLIDQLGLNEEPGEDEDEEMNDAEDDAGSDEQGGSDTSATSISGDVDFDDEDNEEEDNAQVDPVLRAAIEAAFKASGVAEPDSDEDDEDDDEDSGESSAGDAAGDDEMMQLDEKLAEIFKERIGARKQDAEACREAIAFQNKILDLLEIFAKREAGNSLAVRLVEPLFTLVQETDASGAQIAQRAGGILRTLARAKEHPREVSVDEVLEVLRDVHATARKASQDDVQALANNINLYLTKCSVGSNASPQTAPAEELVALHRETLDDYLQRKACALKPVFLVDVFRRFPSVGWALKDHLVQACRPAASAKVFRQLQGLSMLQALLTQVAQVPGMGAHVVVFMADVAGLINSICASSTDAASSAAYNSAQLKEVLKFGLQCLRLTSRAAEGNVEAVKSAWKPAKLKSIAESLATSQRFANSTSLQALLKQMMALANPGEKKEGNKEKGKAGEPKSPAAKQNGKRAATADKGETKAENQPTPKAKKARKS